MTFCPMKRVFNPLVMADDEKFFTTIFYLLVD